RAGRPHSFPTRRSSDLLVVDGARGESVRDAKAPTLQSMQDHAIYSWHSISDTLSINATAWADLLTGVRKEKHRVTNKDFSGNRLDRKSTRLNSSHVKIS